MEPFQTLSEVPKTCQNVFLTARALRKSQRKHSQTSPGTPDIDFNPFKYRSWHGNGDAALLRAGEKKEYIYIYI